jgi:hypothetical protein
MRKQRNLFGFSSVQAKASGAKYRAPGLIQTARQRRVAGMVRKRRGSRSGSASGDLVSALTNLGYKSSEARSMASRAKGSDFDSKLRSALSRNPRWRKTVDEITQNPLQLLTSVFPPDKFVITRRAV